MTFPTSQPEVVLTYQARVLYTDSLDPRFPRLWAEATFDTLSEALAYLGDPTAWDWPYAWPLTRVHSRTLIANVASTWT